MSGTGRPTKTSRQTRAGRAQAAHSGEAAASAGGEPRLAPVSPEGSVVAIRHRHMVIRASAGSGKTYQLAIRYLRKLLDGVPADEILASTFTRKAAGEILARILTRLAKAGQGDDSLRQLALHVGEPSLSQQRCLELLVELTQSLNRLRIGTLDSFFARLATSYTLELGLPPGWEIIDLLADAQLRRQAIEAVLNETQTAEVRRLTALLSKSDSGRRVSTLLQDTVDEFYDIFLRTDHDAWHHRPPTKMLSDEALAEAIEELQGVELPSHKSIQKQRDKDVQAAVDGDWSAFSRNGIAACLTAGQSTYYGKEIPPAAQAVYQRLLNHARGDILHRLNARTAAVYEIVSRFDKVYRDLKRRQRGLRFEDVTRRLAEAFGTAAGSEDALGRLAYRLDGDVTHLLLDEFQDTSLSQWQVLRPFATRITQAQEGTSLFAVGDVKQAIYGWRGGVAEIFDAIDGELDGVKCAPLARSFRSAPAVIEAVNELFQRICRHDNLQQDEGAIRAWCEAVEEHKTFKVDDPGHVTLQTSAAADDENDQAGQVIAAGVDRVQQITAEAPWASVGVLVRQNKHIAPLIATLKRRGIAASEESGNPLTDSAAVLLLLSVLQMADHPGDTIARFHVATSPLGAEFAFTNHCDDKRAAQLSAALRRQLLDDGYGPTFDAWARRLIPCCSRRDVTRLGQLVELAYRYQPQATLRPGDFIRFVEQERVQDPTSARVRVMSVHQAKGLQFDAVVLLLLDHRLIATNPRHFAGGSSSPTSPPELVSVYANKEELPLLPDRYRAAFAQSRAAKIREELCVLYVAVTRAVHALHILIPPSTEKEKSLPANCAGLVRAALAADGRVEPSRLLYERGRSDWAAVARPPVDSAPVVPAGDSSTELVVKLAPMPGGRVRGLGRVAPSRSTDPRTVQLAELVVGSKSAALERGTLFHAWFEQIVWLDAGVPGEDHLRDIARRHGFDDEQTVRHLEDFRAMLERPAIARVLSQQAYMSGQEPPLPPAIAGELAAGPFTFEVGRERPVAVRLQGELLTGTIDRLVLLRAGGRVVAADIVDYKTDAVATDDAANLERAAHYREQLTAYSAAIGQIYRLDPQRIAARLLFVQTGQIVIV